MDETVRTSKQTAILAEISAEEARLAKLERQRDASRARLDSLRAALSASSCDRPCGPESPAPVNTPVPATAADKVRLFRAVT
jgi:hypothetical protein